mmetsp:Transcript_78951/g.218472  ORF Transcript_78951/g.218472 Transcript_78951/m.218472 type:complete len:436 (+) Transcript_78951:108-1415(+)
MAEPPTAGGTPPAGTVVLPPAQAATAAATAAPSAGMASAADAAAGAAPMPVVVLPPSPAAVGLAAAVPGSPNPVVVLPPALAGGGASVDAPAPGPAALAQDPAAAPPTPALATAAAPAASQALVAVSLVAGADGKRAAGGPVKLFVGGLPPEAQDDDLRKHFSQYGELLEAQVIRDRATGRSRNFGFVMLPDGARKDQAIHDNHSICGRRVSVRLHQDMEPLGGSALRDEPPAREAPPPGPGPDTEPKKVFIGRLEPHFTVDMLRSRFSERFGPVADVFLANGKKFGFVTFEHSSAAKAGLDAGTVDVDGVTVVIKSADPMRSGGRDRNDRDHSPPPGGTAAVYGAYPYGYGYAYGLPPYGGYSAPPGYYSGYPPPGYGAPGPGYAPPGYYPSAYGAYGGYPSYGAYYGYYPQASASASYGAAPSPSSSSEYRPY